MTRIENRPATALCAVLLAIAAAPRTIDAQTTRTSAAVFSEHEREALDAMSPQSQAELLLERSINHFRGANEEIAARTARWRGRITLNAKLNGLFETAINSDDHQVRVAGIEVDIAARGLEKTSATIDRLEPLARDGAANARVNALWSLGLLGNRGVDPERVSQILLGSIHDTNPTIRHWAVEGLAYLGTSDIIEPLLDVFRDDPSAEVRERAACSLAQSGMLTERQRRMAVPGLLNLADDTTLDLQTRAWVFQALRDITGQSLPPDTRAWRTWFRSSGGTTAEAIR